MVNDDDFVVFVAKVIAHTNVHFACIIETKSNKGDDFGKRLAKKLGSTWRHHSSTPSAPTGTKPENYVFLWETGTVTAAGSFKFPDNDHPKTKLKLGFPRQHGSRRPSRFPYQGKFTIGGKAVLIVAFHTCFTGVDIAEANQNLAYITEVINESNVIVLGDFNDHPTAGRTYRGDRGFEPLEAIDFKHTLAEPTSLKHIYEASWASTADCRSSAYDNFWVKGKGDLDSPAAEVVDVIDLVTHPKTLHDDIKKVFNNWAKRTNAYKATSRKPWTDIVPYAANETITTLEDTHEAYFVAVSDHLPIKLKVKVK